MASDPPQDAAINLENRDDDSTGPSNHNDFETNRQFLTFSWWLLHRGWRDIMQKVEAAVKDVFGPLRMPEDITSERLSFLIIDVRKQVEGSTPAERSYDILLPPIHLTI